VPRPACLQLCWIAANLQESKPPVTTTSRDVVTLPAKLRQALGLQADDQLIAEIAPEGLLLRPAVTLPVEVYTPEREREFGVAEAELAAMHCLAICRSRPPWRAQSKRSSWIGCLLKTDRCWPLPFAWAVCARHR
jgi:antitoxin PrlF